MVKLQVLDKTGKKTSEVEFSLNDSIRVDIFKKAVLSEVSLFRQTQGAKLEAGKRNTIHVSKRRKAFRTTYGRGGSRTPKKVMWARGTQFRYVGAFAGNTVGGRKAHAPNKDKIILKDINNKEWLKALHTGILASFDNKLVSANGQKVPENYPFVLDNSLEQIEKTKDFKEILDKLGFSNEIERTASKKVRAGIGTMRNRTYKVKRGPLVVVSSVESPLLKASRNIKGFDVITPDLLLVSDFGMSEIPGRAILFTLSAIEEFKKEVLN